MRVCTSCKKLLKADAMRCPDDGAASEVVDALPAGTKLGQYRIERMLGEGGMGFVYAAKHETLNRPTAVKMLRPEFASHKHIVTRFLNEAKAANLINHQNIVSIYDYGNADDGSVYFIMEYLEGEALDDLMHKRRPMPVPLLLHLFGQIAKALAAAHAKQIIHRDLKPANVFVISREDNPYFIKLLDFGIAQLRGTGADEKLTLAGSVLGTPQYMSPEQVMGNDVDVRSDVWALGVMMYRAATGQAAFKGEEFVELADKILHTVPQPPGEIMQLPVSLSQLIMRCLERDPAKRCPTVTALIEGLDQVKQEIHYTDDELLEAVKADSAAQGRPTWSQATLAEKSRAESLRAFHDERPELIKQAGKAQPRRSPLRFVVPGVIALAALGGGAFMLTRNKATIAQLPPGPGSNVGSGSGAETPPVKPPPETILSLIEKGDIAGARALAVELLKQSISKGDLQEKGFAVDGLDLARVPRGAPLLYLALKEPPEVRVKAARALCELHLPDAAAKVRDALAEVSERMKNDLAGAMFCLGDKEGLPILKRALEEPTSKTGAALALANGGSDLGRAVLEDRALNDVGSEAWRKAMAGLLKLGDPKAKKALVAELSQADAGRALNAAKLLASEGDANAKEQLARNAADPEFARRSEAVIALAQLGDKRALEWLPEGFHSTDPEERARAAAVFGMFARDAKQHLLDIGKLATNDRDSRVRMTAEAALLGL